MLRTFSKVDGNTTLDGSTLCIAESASSAPQAWTSSAPRRHFLLRRAMPGSRRPAWTNHHVEGQKGVTQGCPLAAHLFNLALHAIDERGMPEFDEGLKMGCCDDSYFTSGGHS